jgi:hypothetical protein
MEPHGVADASLRRDMTAGITAGEAPHLAEVLASCREHLKQSVGAECQDPITVAMSRVARPTI